MSTIETLTRKENEMGGEIFYLLVMVFIVGSCFGYIIGKNF